MVKPSQIRSHAEPGFRRLMHLWRPLRARMMAAGHALRAHLIRASRLLHPQLKRAETALRPARGRLHLWAQPLVRAAGPSARALGRQLGLASRRLARVIAHGTRAAVHVLRTELLPRLERATEHVRQHPLTRSVLSRLRANPLGPALTVCGVGLVALFVVPHSSLVLLRAPRFVLFEVLLLSPLVPYAVHLVHQTPKRALLYIWAGVYGLALLRLPTWPWRLNPLSLGAHFTGWCLVGFALTAGFALFRWTPKPRARPLPRGYQDHAENRRAG